MSERDYVVVIPSATASNLIPCVQSVLACEATADIIVVDDGARAESEAVLPTVQWVTGVKPFVFARNVNLGIAQAGAKDVILLNDDARLLTPRGFTWLAEYVQRKPDVVCSAGIQGVVCNPNQRVGFFPPWRNERQRLAFVCVYLPRVVIDRVGLLDERFVGYGYDDFDYCRRVLHAGFHLAVWDGCVVEHGELPSTYRTRADIAELLAQGQRIFTDKWQAP